MSHEVEIDHLRYLAKLRLYCEGHSLILIFTRAFLADHYKGLRSVGIKRPKESSLNNHSLSNCTGSKSVREQDGLKKVMCPEESSSAFKDRVYQSRKYFTSVSHTLQTLNQDGISSSDSSSSEKSSEEDDEEVHFRPKSMTPSFLQREETTAPPSKINRSGLDEDFDLEAALRRLGLPTQFGPAPKSSSAPYCNIPWEDSSTWTDYHLLLGAMKFNPFLAQPPLRKRFRSCEHLTGAVDIIRNRCFSSSNDLSDYHRAVFSHLCYLLELACSNEQTGYFAPHNLEIELPRAWESFDFNLDAFLYSCQHYWRHDVPISSRPADGTSVVLSGLGDLASDPILAKYWAQRFRLFSRFNEGVQLDRDGFFSATPEVIAAHQARRVYRALVNDPSAVHRFTVIDACSGAGVNSIQLALLGFHVIAIEIDPARIAMSVHNAQIYGVQSRIEFVCADFFTWAHDQLSERKKTHDTLAYGAVILSPPWGGPTYLEQSVFDLDSIHFGSSPSYNFWLATELASQLSLGNLVIFLPRNTNMTQLSALSSSIRSARLWSSGRHFTTHCPDEIELEVEVNLINSKIKALTVYSGDLCISRERRSIDVSDRPTWSTGEVAFAHDKNNNHFHVDSDPSSSCSSSSCSYLSASENF
ncbi:hypothetical protein CRM22_000433 [Opisthorchis felineus]|uniref:Trimethylguanosine synthase n=1 Tax=Opisthorchis felineus TaxID=147828 RepID=A0A4S2MF05_OPIFE|nr:hypothetical protein CRM22_000433 [Opisthorchis felineus]